MTPRSSMLILCASAAVFGVSAIGRPSPSIAATPPPPQTTETVQGDAAIGAKLFIQCRACHTVDRGGANGVGPNLAGVMGAKGGFHPGYTYSPAMSKASLTWTPATMDAWLKRPSALVPGTKMSFPGMSSPKARADMIAYLRTLKK